MKKGSTKNIFIHPAAIVKTDEIGDETRIYAFSHVLGGVRIGRNCNINDHCFIETGVSIGDNVTVKCGISIWTGVTVEDDVFLGPNMVFTNDLTPRSKQYLQEYPETLVRKGASIGANATILAGTTIGKYAMVGAGSVVTKSVTDHALVYGVPAHNHGYVCECGTKLGKKYSCPKCKRAYKKTRLGLKLK